jgi:hypothetical protein
VLEFTRRHGLVLAHRETTKDPDWMFGQVVHTATSGQRSRRENINDAEVPPHRQPTELFTNLRGTGPRQVPVGG